MTAAFFRVAACVLGSVSTFVFFYTVARAPSRAAGRLGRRGMKRRAALARNGAWSKLEPLVRWLGVRMSGLLPERITDSLDKQILYAGDYLGLTPEEYLALHVLGGVSGVAFGVAMDGFARTHGLAVLGFGILGVMAPWLQVSAEAQERRQKVNRALPFAVDLLSLGLSAGLDFPGALRQVVAKSQPDDPLGEELGYMLQNLQLGHTRKAALLSFAERVPTDAVKEFVQTIVQAEEKGNPIADVLVIQATVSRQRRTTLAEEAASKAGVQMVIPLALIFVTVTLLILAPILMRVRGQIKKSNSNQTPAAFVVVDEPVRRG